MRVHAIMKTIQRRSSPVMLFDFSVAFLMPAKSQRGRYLFIFKALIFTQFIASTLCIWDNEVEDYKKVIFFHEILYRVEEPLQYAVWQQRGDKLQSNKDFYKEFNERMEIFQQQYERGELLKPTEFFGALVRLHYEQAHGLFHFLYQPYDWGTFIQNACWARQHVNAHMFVYAFTLAGVQRQLNHVFMLPKIYEVLPRYFLEQRFVASAREFRNENMSSIQQLAATSAKTELNVWQWWKSIEPFDLSWRSHNLSEIFENNESKSAALNCTNAWWRPVDYTRELHIMNKHAKLTYLTEDVDWNAYWYNLNVFYPFFLSDKNLFWRNETRRSEFWLYSLQQLMTRYELERLSLGFVETPLFNWHDVIETGYDCQLIEVNDIPFEIRENSFKMKIKLNNYDILAESSDALEHIEKSINNAYFFFKNGTKLQLNTSESIKIIADLLQSNIDALDGNFDTHWYLLALLFLAGGVDHKNYVVQPNVLLNFETMLRDPLFYIFHKRIVADFQHFRAQLPPYTKAELNVPGLQILSAHVSELVTFFELHELDASNLQRSKHNKTENHILLARQLRLTHKPFHFNLTIAAEKAMTVMLRIFLAPTQSNHGHSIPLNEKRKNFLELHKILVHLEAGENRKTFSYEKYFDPTRGRADIFHSKLYYDALNPFKRQHLYESYDTVHHCGLNTRLLLPRGSIMGLPMELFFTLNRLDDDEGNQNRWWQHCLPLKGKLAFGFPFDRPIVNEENFKQRNMHWKAVKIYHNEEFVL